ncbi:MAG: hypothetical protein U0457_00455 [Candidatus Sericytochromatia bacterium]
MIIKKQKKKGFSILEMSIGLSIGSIVIFGMGVVQVANLKSVEKSKDVVFAQNKALQIIEELRSVIRGGESSTDTLDLYDDKKSYPPVLTVEKLQSTDTNIIAGSYTSSNTKGSHGNWKFVRHVTVSKNAIDSKSRNVSVAIYYADKEGNPTGTALASLSTILSSSSAVNIPTQVMDTYGLAILNQPGWWAEMTGLKKNFKDAVYDLKVKNPGLDYRFHFISRSAFGRDPYYSPYINNNLPTKDDTNIKYPYSYNGKIYDTVRSKETFYYNVPELLNDGMRLTIDNNKPQNTWYQDSSSVANTNVYSAADEFNSAVRWPEESSINKKFQDYFTNIKKKPEEFEPTYRKFLEDMLSTTDNNPKYRNIMLTNLHGELFPSIPLRNYSDPAKSPVGKEDNKDLATGISSGTTMDSTYKRVVTHPEQLKYKINDTTDTKIYLRVYPYLSNPNSTQTGIDKIDVVSLFIPTSDLVGARSNNTETQSYKNDFYPTDKLSDFQITPSQIQQIKDNLKINYIDGDFIRRGGNLKGYVRITNNSTSSKTFSSGDVITYNPIISGVIGQVTKLKIIDPTSITLPAGSSADIKVSSATDDNTIIKANTTFNFSSAYSGTIKDSSGSTLKGNLVSDFSISESLTNPLKGQYEGSYEIIVNPAFDRFGTGVKKHEKGILIKLYGSRTKHIQSTDGNSLAGLPSNRRLFGMEYIPTPFANVSGNLPKQGTKVFTDYTNATTPATINSNLMGNGVYTGLYGRDLDSTGNQTKNTARWIISFNLGSKATDPSTNVFKNFQDSIMAVETRIGDNLNTGLSINQSPNPYNGEVNQTIIKDNTDFSYEYVKVNDSNINCESSNIDCGTAPYSSFTETNMNKNDLSNLSRTYVWLGEAYLPETEKYQMSGDPRHNPYIDVLENNDINFYFARNGETTTTASYINTGSTYYPNLDPTKYTSTGFSNSKAVTDITKSFKLFRDAIVKTNSIYNSLIGFSFFYYAVGGEVGSNGASVNFTAKGIPYNSATDSKIGESDSSPYNEIMDNLASARIIGSNDGKWLSLPWLGELYPDDKFGGIASLDTDIKWANYGNLEAQVSSSGNYFSRQKYTNSFKSISNDGNTSTKLSDIVFSQKLADNGSKAFFHGSADGSTSNSFSHYYADGTSGALSNTGKDLVANYGLIMPDTIVVPRPFNFSSSSSGVPLWSNYNSEHNTLKMIANSGSFTTSFSDTNTMFYKAADTTRAGSAPVMIDASSYRASERNRGYVIINGLQSQGLEAGTIVSRYSLMSMLHTYLRTGNTTGTTSDTGVLKNRSIMTERTEILDDNSAKKIASYDSSKKYTPREGSDITSAKYPSGVPFYWKTNWRKWNNTKYSSDYSSTWKETDIKVIYNILISDDNGATWKYVKNDGSISSDIATLGKLSRKTENIIATVLTSNFTDSEIFNENGTNINIPTALNNININISSLQQGPVLVRVEGHRIDDYLSANVELPNNYTYHQRVLNVKNE